MSQTIYKVWVQIERINDHGSDFETYEDDGLPDPVFESASREAAVRYIRALPGWNKVSHTSDYREFPRRIDIQSDRRRHRTEETNA